MPEKIDFTEVSGRYEKTSILQNSASETLFNLLNIGENEDVLDAGCGTGNLTDKIRKITRGKVIGIDAAPGMINKAIKKYGSENITFSLVSADEMNYNEDFDVIFCNSTFQWFKSPGKPLAKFYRALKHGGRVGIQSPATKNYCINFINAVRNVEINPVTAEVFKHHIDPWLFLENSADYKNLFEDSGFVVTFSEIIKTSSKHSIEEAFSAFASGAIAGYLNREYYDAELSINYIEEFKKIVKEDFVRQADEFGQVELIFNRIFLTAVKN